MGNTNSRDADTKIDALSSAEFTEDTKEPSFGSAEFSDTSSMEITKPTLEEPRTYPWSIFQLKFLPQNLLPSPGVVPDAISDPSPSVFPRYGHSLSAADTEDGQLLLFGGITKGSATSDLFTFSTQTLEPSVALFQTGGDVPSGRVRHASAFCRSVLIVWGGDTRANHAIEDNAPLDDGLYLFNRAIQEWLKVGVCGPAQEVAMAMLHVWSALDFTFLAVKLTALT